MPSKVLRVDANTLKYQVPGGMLSNMIGQLKQFNAMDKYYDVLAEIPQVRKDFGYPPLVTPTSQIVGTQAVMNVLFGRYKTFPNESKGLLRGEYGKLPAPVNEEVRKMAIGNDKVITCRPADLLKPEMDKYREEIRDQATLRRGRAPATPCSRRLRRSSLSIALRIRRRSIPRCSIRTTRPCRSN